MSVVDRDRFLQCVTRCGALEKEALEKWLAAIDPETGVKELAMDLIRKKLTTKWQAKMLAKGASRLKLGNYLLTDRMAKSEFGDRFTAVHRQLSRDVVIQYLPAEVSNSKESKKRVFTVGSRLADLDHPNLVHVYDVDEEKNRIYLVSESCAGKSLHNYLADAEPLSCKFVASVVSGCLKGLSYAHAKGVVHGGVSESTVVVKPDGDVQIQGLTQFAVQNAVAEKPREASDDLDAVASIGERMLGAVDEKEKDSESLSSLTKAISTIREDSVAALDTLVELANRDSLQELSVDDMVLAPETDRATATSHPATAIAAGVTPAARKGGSGANESIPFDEASEGFLTSIARRNPAALIGASAISALLLIGGTVFAATQLVTSPANTVVAELSDSSGDADGGKAERSRSKKKSRKKNAPPPKVERPNFRNTKGALSDTVGVTVARDSVTNPEANKAAIDAIFNKAPVKEDIVVERVEKVAPAEVAKSEDSAPQPNPAPPAPTEMEVVAVATPAVEVKVVQTQVEDSKEEVLAAGADPFTKFAKTVDLPELASTEQVSFGKLILEKKHLLGAEILSTPVAHRSKPTFVLSRSADDRQSWDIGYKKKKKSAPVVIAKLQKTPNELRFNWLPEAAEINAANFLRNCRVKLSTATHSHWLTLRKPLKIDGFKLGKDRGSVKLDVDIPYMPNPVAIGAALNGIKFERLDKEDWKERAHLVPPEITPTVPARMYFHEDADRFLSIDVLADVRKKLTLRAALVLQPSPDQPARVLEDPRTMPQVAQQIRNIAMAAQQKSNQAQASNLKKEQKELFKKTATKATDQAELTQFYEHVVPQLVEKDIPVTITYALNDQHRIVLAYTVETDETKEK